MSKNLIFIYIINYIYKYYFHVQFSVTAGCACPFFIEIIEIIEIPRIKKFFEKKLAFPLVFFESWSISK